MSYKGNECRIYVGNLPPDIRIREIRDLFRKFGQFRIVDLTQLGSSFVFLKFEDRRDAKDAVRARDGYDYDGYRLRVEFSRNNRNRSDRNNRGIVSKRSKYRVLVSGLPPSSAWQGLKDHMREAGKVCFADTYKDGTGVAEFLYFDDMKYAVKKMDNSRFRSHDGAVTYIRIREDIAEDSNRSRRDSRSRSSSCSTCRLRRSSTYSPMRRRYSRSRYSKY